MAASSRQRLPFTPQWLARWISLWIERHTPEHQSAYSTHRKNIYILPSKAGWLYLATLIAILSGAINYNNSMAYLLCFFLASLAFVAMLQTHHNLSHLTIHCVSTSPVFVGDSIHYQFTASCTDNIKHYAIHCQQTSSNFCVSPTLTTHFSITEPARQRGRQSSNAFTLSTEFPLGLFYAWTLVKLHNQALIYPEPVEFFHSEQFHAAGEETSKLQAGDDEFSGIREYQKGDSMKTLAWKTIARTGQLYSKEFHDESGEQLLFDFDALPSHLDNEEKLSILCGLILKAEQNANSYGLKLADKFVAISSGHEHMHQCLTELALYSK